MIFRNLRPTKQLTSMIEKYSFSLTEMVNIRHENSQYGNGLMRVDYNRLL